MNAIIKISTISALSVLLLGCGANASEHGEPDKPVATNPLVDPNVGSGIKNKSDPTMVTLSSGELPANGIAGSKKLYVIQDEIEFVETWYNYSNEELPDIDFDKRSIVLWERGAINLNHCTSLPRVTGVSFEQFDERLSLTSIDLTKVCDSAEIYCPSEYIEGSPYKLISIPKTQESLVQENLTVIKCE
ncbi:MULTISPECIES: hypothetical protein [Pseudoalteromonas]|uniref:Uncharacterized protein n=1 Tax=Pseudoalteromonas luteoviolacea (strain 2ta16) TaxID=1353533 RepID=V4H7J4_PSEL2|nr:MULTISPECIES: hypothetical protein [Pseudoalteromonas]ESP93436.1 hypothetical protein PL2TA16_03289 [Pseudoalteromonas luteoviolacea 2ta16]KZN43910.1 hypothetical protein N483_08295 [Pseudoalteromonas luteoviolacea NCIMB 1944]MCG7549151.1 hypothetical protein [Pseudoalteromonas sp. Of7M-16]